MRDDTTEQPNGSMIRGCYDGRKPRKSTLPFENGKAAAFWLGVPIAQARAVVVTESAIECLSWLALHTATAGIHCRTYGGNRWRSVEAIFDQVKATRCAARPARSTTTRRGIEQLTILCGSPAKLASWRFGISPKARKTGTTCFAVETRSCE
jgi:hypothetical protein